MKSFRRVLALGVAVLVLVGVVMVGVVAVSTALLPLLIAAGIAVFGLVVGIGTRAMRQPGRRRGSAPPVAPHGDDLGGMEVASSRSRSEPQWVTQWEAGPPPSAVPAVRARLATVLAEWNLTRQAHEAILLVVTELVSNAVEHAQPPVRLIVRIPGDSVRVEVHDSASETPRLQPHDPWNARGRGLQIVEALSTRWGWANGAIGKVVWAEVPTEWTH
jgi:hypothetical protein